MENISPKNEAFEEYPGKPIITYLGTDLIMILSGAVDSVVTELKSHELYVSPTIGNDGQCKLLINTACEDEPRDPDLDISKMLDAMDCLSEKSRKLLAQNTRLDFNSGFHCGDEPWAYSQTLSNKTLQRLASYGATFGITLYPFRAKR